MQASLHPRLLAGSLLLLAAAALGQGAESPEASPLALKSIRVEPSQPAADTLCRLQVEIENRGEATASQLGFAVTINGQPLPVYRNQLFMFPLPPGETTMVPLYNFWTTEAGRPMPEDGKLTIEVTLGEAQWMQITEEEGVETWRPLGAVPGLPAATRVSLEMKAGEG